MLLRLAVQKKNASILIKIAGNRALDYIQGTIEYWKIELSLLMSHNHPQRVLAILAQPMFHVEGILAMGILHQALRGIRLTMRQTARMQEFMDCYFP